MEISVIVPTWEPKEYIYEALESIMDQSFPKERYEIILVLNGGKEPYFSEIGKFLKKKSGQRAKIRKKMENNSKFGLQRELPVIRFVYMEEAGVSKARNLGLSMVRGKYITFMDDDDLVSRDYLEELYRNRRQYGIASAQIEEFQDGSREKIPFFSQEFLREKRGFEFRELFRCRKLFSTCWGHLIPRGIIGDTRFDENLKNGEDSLFMAMISKNVKVVKIVGERACYRRRVRENSAYHSEKIGRERFENRRYLFKRYWKLFWERGYEERFIASRIAATVIGLIRS